MQQQERPQQDNTGRMGSEQQADRDQRETELHQETNFEGTSETDDEDRDGGEDMMAPDETEVGMDKEDYRDSATAPDKSDRRL